MANELDCQMEVSYIELQSRYYFHVPHQTGESDTKLFLRWVQAQSPSQDTPGDSKNSSGLIGIPLKRGVSGARW